MHQTTITSVPGASGFSSKKDAKKVGALVKGKIDRNEMPPSIMVAELKELKIELTNKQ
ncbi:MAG: DUF4907 domain-containing protein [Flavobacteriales bacterium]|nr:DUF4907 domain-containing protein [Flavobacteriales bacterium]